MRMWLISVSPWAFLPTFKRWWRPIPVAMILVAQLRMIIMGLFRMLIIIMMWPDWSIPFLLTAPHLNYRWSTFIRKTRTLKPPWRTRRFSNKGCFQSPTPRPMSWIRGNWIHPMVTAWWFHSVRPTSFSEPEMCLTIWTCMGLQPCWLNTVLRWILPAIGRLGCLLPADPSRKKLIRTTRLIHPTLTAFTRFLSMLLMVMSALLNPRSRSMPWFRGRPITIWWKFVWLWAPTHRNTPRA